MVWQFAFQNNIFNEGGYNEMKGFKGFLKAMMAAAMSVTMTLTALGEEESVHPARFMQPLIR